MALCSFAAHDLLVFLTSQTVNAGNSIAREFNVHLGTQRTLSLLYLHIHIISNVFVGISLHCNNRFWNIVGIINNAEIVIFSRTVPLSVSELFHHIRL